MESEMERSYNDDGSLVDPDTVDWGCECTICRKEYENWCEDYDTEQKFLDKGKFWEVQK